MSKRRLETHDAIWPQAFLKIEVEKSQAFERYLSQALVANGRALAVLEKGWIQARGLQHRVFIVVPETECERPAKASRVNVTVNNPHDAGVFVPGDFGKFARHLIYQHFRDPLVAFGIECSTR